jgi:hypothetical protein
VDQAVVTHAGDIHASGVEFAGIGLAFVEREVDVGLTTKGLAVRQKVASVPERISCSMGLSTESQRQLQQELRVLTENVSNNIPE